MYRSTIYDKVSIQCNMWITEKRWHQAIKTMLLVPVILFPLSGVYQFEVWLIDLDSIIQHSIVISLTKNHTQKNQTNITHHVWGVCVSFYVYIRDLYWRLMVCEKKIRSTILGCIVLKSLKMCIHFNFLFRLFRKFLFYILLVMNVRWSFAKKSRNDIN